MSDLRREKEAIEARYGPWTAHNIRLADDVYTISAEPAGDEVKLRRVTQLALDVCGGSLDGVRVLDLACLEGMYALELARRGAAVMAIEGREANIEKARFAARTLSIDVDFQLGDVRDLSREQHGEFDVVLALGILYHLDAPDLFSLVAGHNRCLELTVGGDGRTKFSFGTHASGVQHEGSMRTDQVQQAYRLIEQSPITGRPLFHSFAPA